MRSEIEGYLEKVKEALYRREVLQTISSVIIIICIFHFITRPKIKYRNVVEVKTEYVDKIVKVDRIVEVEKIVNIPVKMEKQRVVEKYVKDDHLKFDEVFKKYRKQLGADKVFFWRLSSYSTNYKEEVQ
jgi:hypothetical protein